MLNLDELFTAKIKKPQTADFIEIEHCGVRFYIYGILHGLTGGTNLEYKQFVNHTIQQSKGLRLGEKSMSKMYLGLDGELEDWVQVTKKDIFFLTIKLVTSPILISHIIKTLFKERTQLHARFNQNVRRLQDIGGTPYFHLLEPRLRRRYAGFPPPLEYFEENYRRRHTKGVISPIIFPDQDWSWLTHIEKYTNIPYRSIHMIEYALLEAKKQQANEVSLFIGEIHNTDIEWYVNREPLPPHLEKEILLIKSEAKLIAANHYWKKISYFAISCLAAATPIATLFLIFNMLY